MPPLPPTVGERLVKCENQVEVWGIVSGANVDLLIDGAVALTQNNVTGWGTTFTLAAPLVAGNSVTARQTVSGTPSSQSPAVIVGDVELPPPPPRLAPSIYRCASCVYADGMAPGSTLTIFRGQVIEGGGSPIAQTTVGRDGTTCFSPGSGFADNNPIFAVATTCGINSVASPDSALVDTNGPLPAPSIHSPIYGCQTAILMEGLTQGAAIEVFADNVSLGSFCRPDRSLLVLCTAFRARAEQFSNLTVKKIPKAVLSRCEYGHDDYSLQVENLPQAPPETGQQPLFDED